MSRRDRRYDVLDKWDSVSFDAVTRAVLRLRLHEVPQRRFFTEAEWVLLEALAARLAPTPERGGSVPIVPWIDAALHEGRGEGFRAPDMPPLQEAWRRGLKAIDAEAQARYARRFADLPVELQAAECRRLVAGEADQSLWDIPARPFVVDMLLKTVVGVYYGHPAAQSEMGYGGPASPRGYVRIGLNERDPWEAPLDGQERRR